MENKIIENKSFELFKLIRENLWDDKNFNNKLDMLEEVYLKLSKILEHDRCIYEIGRRYKGKYGFWIDIPDYDKHPSVNNSRDVILGLNGSSIPLLKKVGNNKETFANIQIKCIIPRAKYQDISLNDYMCYKYWKNDVKIIFCVPNGSDPKYYNGNYNKETHSATEHTFYYCDLKKLKNGDIFKTNSTNTSFKKNWFFPLKNLEKLDNVLMDQTEIKDYEKKKTDIFTGMV